MSLTTAQLDRASGVLLAAACGDALGVPYEFGVPPRDGQPARMLGGGLGAYAPGEWSDDTQMAICIAQVTATGRDLRDADSLDEVAAGFCHWARTGATDIGVQTRRVLAATADPDRAGVAQRMLAASRQLHASTGHTAGNGALMRTAVVGLAFLEDPDATAEAARLVAGLTHADPLAGDSCVIWSLAVRRAVLDGSFEGVRESLEWLPAKRRQWWRMRLDEAEGAAPAPFARNGFTVTALQAAWASITSTPVPTDDPANGSFACRHLQDSLHAAVRVGHDTDTVAAVAGALLGARWGASAVPATWRRQVHGWPQLRARDLVALGVLTARRGRVDGAGWPTVPAMTYGERPRPAVPHPADADVLLGTRCTTDHGCDAVVSLCRMGAEDVPLPGVAPADHVEVWLVDSPDPADNPNLEFVLDDAARLVRDLRGEGRRVLLHCVRAQSRTPAVAARYGVLLGRTADQALRDVAAALRPPLNSWLGAAVRRLGDH